MRRLLHVVAVMVGAAVLSAHVGSPNVFYRGMAGPYEVRVVVRPPEVVPGVARVTVRTSDDVRRVSIRPVFWRAGSRGAPSADEARRLEGEARTFEGSLWLMQHGAYSVDVIVDGSQGVANTLIPVASVATGRLRMGAGMAILLTGLGLTLCVGLVNIIYKSAGEGLVPLGSPMDPARLRRARRVAAVSVPLLGLALLGGARWWGAVDRDYERNMYRPSPLYIERDSIGLVVRLSDTTWQPGRRVDPLVADHGKLMHLFLVRSGDAGAFAHLHPIATDTSAIPSFRLQPPALGAGDYHVFADVVHETGFERTLVGSLRLDGSKVDSHPLDPDDAWFVGEASRANTFRLGDGSTIAMQFDPAGAAEAGHELALRFTTTGPDGTPARLEPYLGMAAHAVVVRTDGGVYVHLHPMGTVSAASQLAFRARDRGDTTDAGRLRVDQHSLHSPDSALPAVVEFPYAFPSAGDYRVFVQVKRNGRILTGAFAVTVTERAER